MELIVNDIYTTVVGNAKEVAAVHDILRARPEGYRHMPRYKQGVWDGYISLMSSHLSFPSGLVPHVAFELQERGVDVIVNVTYKLHDVQVMPNCLNGVTLRDYQVNAANALLKATRGIAKMATNAGKTEVIAAIVIALFGRAVVIVHRKELLHQTTERLQDRIGAKVNKIGDGHMELLHDSMDVQVTVCMIQTLANLPNYSPFKHNEILIIDECHHGSSAQMLKVLHNIPGGWRFGFSGTPLKHDKLSDMQLMGITGEVVVDVNNAFLIGEGYSATPEVVLHTVYDEDGWNIPYQDAVQMYVVDNHERNVVIASVANTSKGVVLLLVDRIEHGKILQSMMPSSTFVTGAEDSHTRLQVLERMRSGKQGIYIATTIFDEGVDVPAVDVVILAAGGKSQVKLLQRIGRGMRKKGGENIVTIHDFIDDTNKHLLDHSEARVKTYEREGFTTRVMPVDDVLPTSVEI